MFVINPLYTVNPITGTLANSEDPDEMQHNLENSTYNPLILFDLILKYESTIFQLCQDRSSWVEPVLSKD